MIVYNYINVIIRGAIISLFGSFCFSQTDTLSSNQKLSVNQCIYSTSGVYSLCYQADAHLVGYDCKGTPFWANSPYNYSPQYCIMQSDGNFCCYDINHLPKWCSNTYNVGVAPYRLVIQSDRNIVLYDGTNRAIWSSSTSVSGTSIICPTFSPTFSPSPAIGSTLQPTTVGPTQIPTIGPTLQPTTSPTVVPFVPLFSTALLSFSGSNFDLYSSLPQALNNSFTVSLWVVALSPYPALLVSLGRSAAHPDSGQFTIEIDKNGHIHFWDYSLATTGRGFSVLSGDLIVKGIASIS